MAVPSSAQAARESTGLSAVSSQERFEQLVGHSSKDFLRRFSRLNYRQRGPRITVRNRKVNVRARNETAVKPSLTLSLLFMARHRRAP